MLSPNKRRWPRESRHLPFDSHGAIQIKRAPFKAFRQRHRLSVYVRFQKEALYRGDSTARSLIGISLFFSPSNWSSRRAASTAASHRGAIRSRPLAIHTRLHRLTRETWLESAQLISFVFLVCISRALPQSDFLRARATARRARTSRRPSVRSEWPFLFYLFFFLFLFRKRRRLVFYANKSCAKSSAAGRTLFSCLAAICLFKSRAPL